MVAELLMDGKTRQEVADAIGEGTHKDTISEWRKDPQIQAHMSRIREERINRVDRLIVAELMAKLETPAERRKLSTKELLEIRRELLPPAAQRHVISRGADEATVLAELHSRLAADPELAEALGLGPAALPPGDIEGEASDA